MYTIQSTVSYQYICTNEQTTNKGNDRIIKLFDFHAFKSKRKCPVKWKLIAIDNKEK